MNNDRPVVLVTGAARRLGAATARHLHARGMDVAVHCHRSVDDARALAAEMNAARPESAIVVAQDLATQGGCQEAVGQAAAWRGRLDHVVNNASSFYRTQIEEVAEADWAALMDGNAKAALFVVQAALPWLRAAHAAAVVNIADVRIERPLPYFAPYIAAKAALVALTRSMALELAPAIRVNAISPGSMDWPTDQGAFSANERAELERLIPLGRLGTGQDIARAVEFLLVGNDYITGQVLAVDGGTQLATMPT